MRFVALLLPVLLLILIGCGGGSVTVVKTSPPPGNTDRVMALSDQDISKSEHHLDLAKKSYFKGKYEQAEKQCELAIKFDRSNWEAFYYLGLVMQKKREYAESIEVLKIGLKLGPENKYVRSDIHFNLGVNFEQMGKPDMARDEYNRALAYNSGNQMARKGLNRIKVTRTLKNWDEDRAINPEG